MRVRGSPRREPTAQCERCMRQNWRLAARAGTKGHRFTGICGLTNFWAAFQVMRLCPFTAILQARVIDSKAARGSTPQERARPQPQSKRSSDGYDSAHGQVTDAANFKRAIRLMRLVLHYLEEAAARRFVERELDQAQRSLLGFAIEKTRLQQELEHRINVIPDSPDPVRSGHPPERLVTMMIDYLHQNCFCQPRLKELAATLGMNAAYLSSLFGRLTGLRFHEYLAELRLAKAKELLRDPLKQVCEVARAVGYPDQNTFRQAFKKRTGLSPSAWRQ